MTICGAVSDFVFGSQHFFFSQTYSNTAALKVLYQNESTGQFVNLVLLKMYSKKKKA